MTRSKKSKKSSSSGGSGISFCGCFSKFEDVTAPEITHHDVILQPAVVAIERPPMPHQDEVEKSFAEFVVKFVQSSF